ncbi:hypothetical protein A9O66_24785 [Paraburkholderia caribensis]|uniref:Bacterial transcriptional activator domain-containing protein n=3 Tax=Pseudomonadota TaxID=1224 RepID=A0A9Q6S652_9BURK|nr:hypothetical protein A9O66_24785 [Paraburkholderia caribensis]
MSLTEPPKEFSRLLANQCIEILGWDLLRLTLDETSQIAASKVHLDSASVSILQKQSDGWVAGLMLMLEHIRRKGCHEGAIAQETSETTFNYFAGLVFDQASETVQDFLLRTAYLPDMTVETARIISQQADTTGILDTLYRRHLFTERRDRNFHIFQYHTLFRAFLLNRGMQQFGAAVCEELAASAGKILEDNHQIEQAVELYTRANDKNSCARLICKYAPGYLEQGRHGLITEWAAWVLPRDDVPWLSYWYGASRMPFDPEGARSTFCDAFLRFKTIEDHVGCLLCASAIIESFFLERAEDLRPADSWIQELERSLERLPEQLPQWVEARLIPCLQGLIYRQPEHPLLPDWIEKACAFLDTSRSVDQRLMTGAVILMHKVWQGDFINAASLVRKLEPLRADAEVAPLSVICWKLQRARFHWATGAPDTALELLGEAIRVSNDSGVHAMDRYIHAQRAYAYLAAQRYEAAQECLDVMETLLEPRFGPDTALFNYLTSGARLLASDFRDAVRFSERGLDAALSCGMPVGTALCHIALAQALVMTDRIPAAGCHLGAALEIAQSMRSPLFEHSCYAFLAYSDMLVGKDEAAQIALMRCLAIARNHGFSSIHPWARPEVLPKLLAFALERNIEVEYVRSLIRRQRLLPQSPDVSTWLWTVKVRALGGFDLFMYDEPLISHGKAQRKPLQLLQLLVAHPEGRVNKAVLIDQIWPELDGDAGVNAFELALHRLRKLVARDDAIVMKEGWVTLDPRQFWVDAWQLERLASSSAYDATRSSLDALLTRAETAISLYRGHFLEGEDAPWVLAPRARLRNQFLRTISTVGRSLEQLARWDELIMLSRRAIEVDPLCEEFHRMLMIGLRGRGSLAEAIDSYRQCHHILSITLGVEPSAKMKALYRSLTQS